MGGAGGVSRGGQNLTWVSLGGSEPHLGDGAGEFLGGTEAHADETGDGAVVVVKGWSGGFGGQRQPRPTSVFAEQVFGLDGGHGVSFKICWWHPL